MNLQIEIILKLVDYFTVLNHKLIPTFIHSNLVVRISFDTIFFCIKFSIKCFIFKFQANEEIKVLNLEVDDEEPAVDVAPKGNSLFSEVEDRRHIGQAHHMFSRFLKLRIYDFFHKIFFVLFFY